MVFVSVRIATQPARHEAGSEKLSRMSIFSVIHPALAAALTPERTQPIKLPAKEPLSKIQYTSSPLKGTETRDRLSLGLYPGASLSPLKPALQHSPKRSLSTHPNLELNQSHLHPQLRQAPFTSTTQPEGPPVLTSYNQIDPIAFQSPSEVHLPRALSPSSPIGSRVNAQSEISQNEAPQTQTSSGESPISQPPMDSQPLVALKSLGASLWNSLVGNVKRTVGTIIPRKATPPPLPAQSAAPSKEVSEIGYTEEELNALIDDMMQEIQSRSEDAKAHQEMLRKNNRWSINDDTGGGPLFNMRTQVVVDPEIVAQALASSARKLILSKHPRPSREATLELLRAAQVKLVEVLRPVVK